nr:uncharacterized protein LOC106618094 [Bactrocera oleae]
MLIRSVLLVATAVCLVCDAVSGDTKPEKLTSFRPISQAEYEAILNLSEGKTVISEGRLINSGLAALAGLTMDWVTSLGFPNILGSVSPAQKPPSGSYPLCVIRTEDAPGSEHHHVYQGRHIHHAYHNRQGRSDDNESQESAEEVHLQHHEGHSNVDHSEEHTSSIEMVGNKNKWAPVVNCIVVLKENEQHVDEDDHHYHHTTTKRPKRKRRKHRPYTVLLPVTPPILPAYQPALPYPHQPQPQVPTYSASQSPYSAASPYGTYNNPWYWQTAHYNPYYSEPTTFTSIYPPAYSDIYTTNRPGPYTHTYPGAYSGSFASSPAGNNPGPSYDAPPSAYPDPPPSDSYDPQPSSYTSHYSNQEVALNRNSPSPNSESSYIYGPTSNGGGVAVIGREHYTKYYDERSRENQNSSAKSKKSASASKGSTITKTQRSKGIAKTRPPNDSIDSGFAPTKVPIRGRHTKVKRDESGIQTRSYAKIASYSESGYQPTLYPQFNYQSNYPKVSYNHALPYTAPVYVRNSIEQQSVATNTKPVHTTVGST